MNNQKFVICINNSEHPASLELRKIYEAIPDKDAADMDHIRVIDESGEDYLYPSSCFIETQLTKEVREAIIKAA